MDPEENDDDAGVLAEAFGEDQAGIMQYLESVIGEMGDGTLDEDFVEEFRNSELFADVMRECGMAVNAQQNNSNPSINSRRPSATGSDRGARGNSQTGSPMDPPVDVTSSGIPDQLNVSGRSASSEQSPSSSMNVPPPTKRSKKKKTGRVIDLDTTPSENSSGEDHAVGEKRSQAKNKVRDKLKIRPPLATSTPIVSSSSSFKKTESKKKEKPGPKSKNAQQSPHSQRQPTPPAQRSKSGNTFQDFPRKSVKDVGGGPSCHNVPSVDSKMNSCTVHLMNLFRQPKLFPNGVKKKVTLTFKLLDEIYQCETKLRSACRKCVNVKPISRIILKDNERSQPSSGIGTSSEQTSAASPAKRQKLEIRQEAKTQQQSVQKIMKTNSVMGRSYKDAVRGIKEDSREPVTVQKEASSKENKARVSASPDKLSTKNLQSDVGTKKKHGSPSPDKQRTRIMHPDTKPKNKHKSPSPDKQLTKNWQPDANRKEKQDFSTPAKTSTKLTAPEDRAKKKHKTSSATAVDVDAKKRQKSSSPEKTITPPEVESKKQQQSSPPENTSSELKAINKQKSSLSEKTISSPIEEQESSSQKEIIIPTETEANKKPESSPPEKPITSEVESTKKKPCPVLGLDGLVGLCKGLKNAGCKNQSSTSPTSLTPPTKVQETNSDSPTGNLRTSSPLFDQPLPTLVRKRTSTGEKEQNSSSEVLTELSSKPSSPPPQEKPERKLSSEDNEAESNPLVTEKTTENKQQSEESAATEKEPTVTAAPEIEIEVEKSNQPSGEVVEAEKKESLEQDKDKSHVKEVDVGTTQSVPAMPQEAQIDKENTTDDEKITPEKLTQPVNEESINQVKMNSEKEASPSSEIIDVEDFESPPSPVDNVDLASPPPSPTGDDSREPSSPEITGMRKSPTPDRTPSKKKNVIESSSDDGDHRREDADMTDDTTPERKRSSDDEQPGSKKEVRFAAHNPSIERKREHEDSRSGKFGEFEMERQRKKDKKRGKPGKNDPFEDFMKDKQLGSFRIPKKTTATSKRSDTRNLMTPLTSVAVPKENMQFERFRKGLSDKDKIEKKERGEWKDRGDWNNRNFNDSRSGGGDQKFGGNRMNRESGGGGAFDRHKLRDDGRVVLLAPDQVKQDQETGDAEREPPESAPAWADDGEEPGGGDSPEMGDTGVVEDDGGKETDNQAESENNVVNVGDVKGEIKEEQDDEVTVVEEDAIDDANPEIPIETVEVNPFSVGAIMLLQENPTPKLPDVGVEKLAEATMMKVAWWFSEADLENSKDVASREDWYKILEDGDSDNDGAQSDDDNDSFQELLKFTQSEDEEVYNCLTREQQRRKSNGPIDEHCGRQLLVSQYRSGPDDKFSNIFQLRGGNAQPYDKENFQARCTLCDILVIGRNKLASHVVSDLHIEKMSKIGMDKPVETTDKESDSKENSKEAKKSDVVSKNGDVKKGATLESPGTKDKSKDDPKDKDDDSRKGKRHKDKKRKRSKDESSSEKSRDESGAEVGVTSTGAIPDRDRKNSESKDKRSPRHKRNRSRSPRPHESKDRDKSPRRRSKSRSPHGSSSRRRRSRSRSRDRARDRAREPVVRISRSPNRHRRRSTSAERVEKFLAKTQQRSRSPSNGYRKRHRQSSPPPAPSTLPKKTNKEFHEKMILTMDGKWTEELDNKWKIMEAEEAIFMEQFGEKSKALKTTPESHPNYGAEWTAFWERRYQELEEEGKDPEKHNMIPEWKDYWTKKLREVLEKEYEDGIKEIKVRNGVDIETLQKLRITPKEPPVVQLKAEAFISQQQIPQPVPAPSCLPPFGIPPPQPFIPQVPSITGTITPSSKSMSEYGEDMTSRPMSISDGGDQPASLRNAPSAAPSAVTTNDVMSTWEKLKSGGLGGKQSQTSNAPAPLAQPAPRSQSTVKSVDGRSIADSDTSIATYPFPGEIDVTGTLHKMNKLEDQLSFFANKVREYYHKAEELDLKKHNKSYELLTDEDFVALLFNIRDRFMAMIRAHILPSDTLDELNQCVYSLNGVLDHPDCKKRRPKTLNTPEIPPPKQDIRPPAAAAPAAPNNFNETFTRPTPSSSSHSKNSLRNLPDAKQKEISAFMTYFVISMGREDLSDGELKELLRKLLQKPTSATPSASNSARNSTPGTPVREFGTPNVNNADRDSDSSVRSVRYGEMAELDPWRLPDRNVTRLFSVASVQAAGTAVPELPNVIPQFHNPSGGGGGPIRFGSGSGVEGGGGGWGRGQNVPAHDRDYISSSSSGTGRHSPFSRRDFTGNPVSANPFRDKAACASSSTSANKRRSSTAQKENVKGKEDSNLPTVTVGTSSMLFEVKRKLSEIKRQPEIQMAQLTKYKETSQEIRTVRTEVFGGGASVEEEIAYHFRRDEQVVQVRRKSTEDRIHSRRVEEEEPPLDNPNNVANLPPGIMNMIIKERTIRQKLKTAEIGEIVSNGQEEEEAYCRRRQLKKKRKKRRAKENRSSSDSTEEDSDSESKYARDRSRERRKRREKKRRRKSESLRGSSASRSERKERTGSSSSEVVERRRESRRRAPQSPSPDRRRESRRRRNSSNAGEINMRRSRRPGHSRTYERRRRESEQLSVSSSDRRREKRRNSRSSSSPERLSRERRESHQRRDQTDQVLYSDQSDIIVECIKRRAPARFQMDGEENENSQRSIKSEGYKIPEQGTRRVAPLRESELSGDDMVEYSPMPLQSSSRSFLRESNLRSGRKPERRYDVSRAYVPSPTASVNSGSSGYRRTKQRSSVTTVTMPSGCRQAPNIENWETLSEVSSLGGGDKDKAVPSSGVGAKLHGKPNVTSVSKTFWTENDEDAKSLSSISSHDVGPSKRVEEPTTVQTSTAEVNPVAPKRNYRVSMEEDKEPGEISSSSHELGEI